eukprot:5136721-Prymnesium_polylepis.2
MAHLDAKPLAESAAAQRLAAVRRLIALKARWHAEMLSPIGPARGGKPQVVLRRPRAHAISAAAAPSPQVQMRGKLRRAGRCDDGTRSVEGHSHQREGRGSEAERRQR